MRQGVGYPKGPQRLTTCKGQHKASNPRNDSRSENPGLLRVKAQTSLAERQHGAGAILALPHNGGASMSDPLKPSVSLLVKLGSLIVHLEESQSANGHTFDKVAAEGLQNDPEVQQWLIAMTKMAMLPVKR